MQNEIKNIQRNMDKELLNSLSNIIKEKGQIAILIVILLEKISKRKSNKEIIDFYSRIYNDNDITRKQVGRVMIEMVLFVMLEKTGDKQIIDKFTNMFKEDDAECEHPHQDIEEIMGKDISDEKKVKELNEYERKSELKIKEMEIQKAALETYYKVFKIMNDHMNKARRIK